MRLVIFVNTILQLNFLNITVSVYYCGMNMLSNANQHKDLIQESLVAENNYALPFSK